MASLIGSAIVLLIGSLAVLWFPVRIQAVWNEEKAAPPIPIRTRSHHIVDFEVTDRNFPTIGASFFCLAMFGFLTGASGVLDSVGLSTVSEQLMGGGVAMMAPALLFAITAQIIYSFDRPQFLVPPHLRGEYDRDERSAETAAGEEFDFTNEEVQQLLQTDDDLLNNLEGMVADDLAHLVYEDEEESHYAVLDIWWNQVAREFGHEPPEEDDGGAYLVTLASTEAYQDHADRVGEYPEVESNICGTSPFIVEHQAESTKDVPLDNQTEKN
ncbi:hypothetical protein [Halocatena pleomorpha]|uniref:Uncharacterized protein n=1 Tax=Halocatena pleomorpha TaxID=1785090 RepID=A0A3P3R617_9EURY|nr:hypothetical protein [Halocatena pleomorpha]RRJ28896.1 hypothetical protein EIK79_14370 [Halocatena pleomorpha]